MTTLEYGDIIQFYAPRNPELHEKVMMIEYIDESQIITVDDTKNSYTFNVENGMFTDESIDSVSLLSRSEEKGYARQNNLLPSTWVTVRIGGDLPVTINAQITDLEDDMITLQTYPEQDTIYLDFGYNGIPRTIPIESITIREPPQETRMEPSVEESTKEAGESDQPDEIYDEVPVERTQQMIDVEDIEFGDYMQEVEEVVQVRESERRYDLGTQTQDLLDEILSHIPDRQRTNRVMNQVQQVLQRFQQLYSLFSQMKENGTVERTKYKGKDFKPLVESLLAMKTNLYWLLPVSKRNETILEEKDANAYSGNLQDIQSRYAQNQLEGDNPYVSYIRSFMKQQNDRDPSAMVELLLDDMRTTTNMISEGGEGDLQLTVQNKEKLMLRRYVIERYGLGIKRPLPIPRSTLKVHPLETSTFAQTTHPDKVNISSMVLLSRPAIEYSRAFLPNTSLLDRIHTKPILQSELLRSQPITRHEITQDDIDDGISYKEDNQNTFLDNIKHIVMDESIEENKYEKFLHAMIPRTLELFTMIQSGIQNKLSLHKIMESMEPFCVYHNDLTFTQYKTIVSYIDRALKEWKAEYEKNRVLRKPMEGIYVGTLVLRELFTRPILENYEVDNQPNLSGWSSITQQDGANLLYTAVLAQNATLHSEDVMSYVDQLSNLLNEPRNLRIAKEYTSMDDLKADEYSLEGARDILYTTTRDLPVNKDEIVRYFHANAPDSIKARPIEEVRPQLKEFMFEKMRGRYTDPYTGEPVEGSALDDEIDAILRGHRIVQDGDYAILRERRVYQNAEGEEIMEQEDPKYYIREQQRWNPVELEPMIDPDTQGKAIEYMANQMIRQFNQEQDNQEKGKQERISKRFMDAIERLRTLNRVKEAIQRTHREKIQDIASKWVNTHDAVQPSPYQPLFQRIMGEEDFRLKQEYILRFVNAYTHIGTYFYQCNETGVNLVPKFLVDLANAYTQSGSAKYQSVMEDIISAQGVLGDDGGTIVDKYTGYPIRVLDLSTDEGYDGQGFAVKSRDVVEDTPEQVQEEDYESRLKKLESSSKIHQYSLRVMNAMLQQMQVENPMFEVREQIANRVFQFTSSFLDKLEIQGKIKKENQAVYNTQQNETILYSTLAYLSVYLQTVPVKVKRSFPGCVESFQGYPHGTDKSNVVYLACVANKIKSRTNPWIILKRETDESITDKIISFIDKVVMRDDTVPKQYVEQEVPIAQEHRIGQWETFLPPLEQSMISTKEAKKSKEYRGLLKDMIKSGDPKQHTLINAIRGDAIVYSLSVQDQIQNVLNDEKTILVTSKDVPYLQNVCCEGSGETYSYFVEKNKKIHSRNEFSQKLVKLLETTRVKAPIYFDPRDTKLVYPPVSYEYTETTIYKAFIKYCQYNKGIPLEDEFIGICVRNTSEFTKQDTLREKIEIMKREGAEYNTSSIEQLLDTIHRRNYVDLYIQETHESCRTKLDTLLEKLDKENDETVNGNLKTHLKTLLDSYDLVSNENPAYDELYNFLVTSNRSMSNKIQRFLKQYAKQETSENKKEYKRSMLFLKELGEWKPHNTELGSFMDEENTTVSYIRAFFETICKEFATVYPTMILQNKKPNKTIPSYWNLGSSVNMELTKYVTEYYAGFQPFMNPEVQFVMKEIQQKHKHMITILDSIPLLVYGKSVFSHTIVNQLMMYCFYSIGVSYIDIAGQLEEEALQVEKRKKSIGEYIQTVLSMFHKRKEIYNVNYEEIYAKILKQREQEKKRMTSKFENLTTDQLRIKNTVKNLRLGEFAAGEQKGLYRHDPQYADKERKEMEADLLNDMRAREQGDTRNIDLYRMDVEEDARIQEEIDREEYDMSGLPEDDDYGDRDGDEMY